MLFFPMHICLYSTFNDYHFLFRFPLTRFINAYRPFVDLELVQAR